MRIIDLWYKINELKKRRGKRAMGRVKQADQRGNTGATRWGIKGAETECEMVESGWRRAECWDLGGEKSKLVIGDMSHQIILGFALI